MSELPFRFDFAVPNGVDVQEPPPPGKTVFDGEVVPNPVLDRVRAGLDADPRWSVRRVSPLLPDQPNASQRFVVWVDPASDADDQDVQSGVADIVTAEVPGASLIATSRTGL